MYERLIDAVRPLNKPVLLMLHGTDEQTLLTAKKLILENLAEVAVVGQVAEVSIACYKCKVNDAALYGILHPDTYPWREALIERLKQQFPEENGKALSKRLREPLTFGQLLLERGEVDYLVDGDQILPRN